MWKKNIFFVFRFVKSEKIHFWAKNYQKSIKKFWIIFEGYLKYLYVFQYEWSE